MIDDVAVPKQDPSDSSNQQKNLVASFDKMVEFQTKEVEVKRLELDVRSQEISSNERIAIKSIEAQERSHSDGRTQFNKLLIHRYVFLCFAALIVAGFTIAMVMNGAKEIILEIVKITSALATGAFGGYYAGKNKKDPEE